MAETSLRRNECPPGSPAVFMSNPAAGQPPEWSIVPKCAGRNTCRRVDPYSKSRPQIRGHPCTSDARSRVVAISILKQTISKADKPHLAHLDPERKRRANLYPITASPTTAQSCQKIGIIIYGLWFRCAAAAGRLNRNLSTETLALGGQNWMKPNLMRSNGIKGRPSSQRGL